MKRLLIGLAMLMWIVSSGHANGFLESYYFFPIISNTEGRGGTRWATELSLHNPHSYELVLTFRVSAGGSFTESTATIGANETALWEDFAGTELGLDGNGAMLVEAEPERNLDRPESCLVFVASMRIYNTASGSGTFGQGIAPADPVRGFVGSWDAYFTGVRAFGEPGVDGFRTNIGFWHLGEEDRTLSLRLVDEQGTVLWGKDLIVRRHEPLIIPVAPQFDTDAATLVVSPGREWVDCAVWISVVDNRTGDAAFRTGFIRSPDAGIGCTEPAAAISDTDRTLAGRRLKALFLSRGDRSEADTRPGTW